MDALLHMKLTAGVQFNHLASVYQEYTGKIAVENLRPSWLIFSQGFRKSRLLAAAKRATDIVLSFLGLIALLPVMLIAALAIRLTSRGPALYRQQRVGKEGRTFTIQKFRSMRSDAEARTGAVWSIAGDPRVTPVGRILRRTRLDELPQLWNVLIGDMSLVGPRPERPEFVAELAQQIPFYGPASCCTGLASLDGPRSVTVTGPLSMTRFRSFSMTCSTSSGCQWHSTFSLGSKR